MTDDLRSWKGIINNLNTSSMQDLATLAHIFTLVGTCFIRVLVNLVIAPLIYLLTRFSSWRRVDISEKAILQIVFNRLPAKDSVITVNVKQGSDTQHYRSASIYISLFCSLLHGQNVEEDDDKDKTRTLGRLH